MTLKLVLVSYWGNFGPTWPNTGPLQVLNINLIQSHT